MSYTQRVLEREKRSLTIEKNRLNHCLEERFISQQQEVWDAIRLAEERIEEIQTSINIIINFNEGK